MTSPTLREASFEVTRHCNLRCTTCDHPLLATTERPLSPDLLCRAVADAIGLGAGRIVLSGGEPLVYPGLDDLVREAKRSGAFVVVATNGTLLSPARIAELIQAGVARFVVSLHGDAAHDAYVRGPGAHDLAMGAVRHLVSTGQGARLAVNVTVTRANCDGIAAWAADLRRMGVRRVTFSAFASSFLVRDVARRRAELELPPGWVDAHEELFGARADRSGEPCPHVLETCVVEADGTVSPCWEHRGRRTLREATLADIVLDPAYRDRARRAGAACPGCALACYALAPVPGSATSGSTRTASRRAR